LCLFRDTVGTVPSSLLQDSLVASTTHVFKDATAIANDHVLVIDLRIASATIMEISIGPTLPTKSSTNTANRIDTLNALVHSLGTSTARNKQLAQNGCP
jgi:hypothetical protein